MWDLRTTFLFYPNALLSFLCQTACCAAFQNNFNVFTAPVTTVIICDILLICFYVSWVLITFNFFSVVTTVLDQTRTEVPE